MEIELTSKQKTAIINYLQGYSLKAILEDVDDLWENHDPDSESDAVANEVENFIFRLFHIWDEILEDELDEQNEN